MDILSSREKKEILELGSGEDHIMKNYNTLGTNTGGYDINGKWAEKDLNSQCEHKKKRH